MAEKAAGGKCRLKLFDEIFGCNWTLTFLIEICHGAHLGRDGVVSHSTIEEMLGLASGVVDGTCTECIRLLIVESIKQLSGDGNAGRSALLS
jgi:hypothetical protein